MNKNKNRFKIILLLLIGSLIAVFVGNFAAKSFAAKDEKSQNSSKSKEAKSSPPAFIKVSVAKPKQGDLENSFSLTGTVIPRTALVISSELSGVRVKSIFVEAGEYVKKGQKLAEFDNQILDGNLDEIESDYELAKDEFLRVEKIKNSQAVSRSFYMEKKSRYKSAKAKLDNARTNINRSVIRAPFSGLVYERKIEVGSLVNANEKLFSMTKSSDLDLEVQAPEDLLSKIDVGNEAEIEIIGNDNVLSGKVRAVIPRIDPDTRNFSIKIAIAKSEEKIAVGSFGTARIGASKKSGYVIPATAMQDDSGSKYVYVVNRENRVERRDVIVVTRNEKNILVENLDGNEDVVLKAGSFVRVGDVVEPMSVEE
jgi:HlyD family secretion protein